MSVRLLGSGWRPAWLRALEQGPAEGAEAIVVVNDLSAQTLRDVARACALRAARPDLDVAILTRVEHGLSPAEAVIASLPPERRLPADAQLAMALLGSRWAGATLQANAGGLTVEYRG